MKLSFRFLIASSFVLMFSLPHLALSQSVWTVNSDYLPETGIPADDLRRNNDGHPQDGLPTVLALLDNVVVAEKYELDVDAGILSPGTYFIILQTDSVHLSERL